MPMLLVPTFLAVSDIPFAGLGLFALDTIPAGTVVWRRVPGLDLEVNELPADPVQRQFVLKFGYVPLEGPRIWVVCMDNGRFVNHSDTPNTIDTSDETIARVDIPAGAEITSDYRTFCREPFVAWSS